MNRVLHFQILKAKEQNQVIFFVLFLVFNLYLIFTLEKGSDFYKLKPAFNPFLASQNKTTLFRNKNILGMANISTSMLVLAC